MALLEGPPVIAEDLLEGVFVDPLSVMCHGRWLYHTLPLGSTCLPSLPCAPPWSLERGTQGQHKKEILIRYIYRSQAKDGTCSFYAYATLYVMRKNKRVTISLPAVRAHDTTIAVLTRLFDQISPLNLKIKRLY